MDTVIVSRNLPQDDGFAFIREETLVPGGSASNLSVAAASLGMSVWQTGKIGDDLYGKLFREDLRSQNINDCFLQVKEGGTTLHTYILNALDGKHCIYANIGNTVCELLPEELPRNILDKIDIFYTDMFSGKAAIYLAERALKEKKTVVYNMQCTPTFMKECGTTLDEIEKMLHMCTLFSSGKAGYSEMTGERNPVRAMEIIQKRYQIAEGVVCTMGRSGSLWLYNGEVYHADAFPIKVIDTTGAGDCFLAGLIYAYFMREMPKPKALRFGNAVAAVKCMQNNPRLRSNLSEVEEFMRLHP